MTVPEPVPWAVQAVVKVTDGDTVHLIRSRPVNLDGRHYTLTDHDPERPDRPRGVAVRLLWVDTPERGDHPGWEDARADLTRWISAAQANDPGGPSGGLRVICYESGGWDRIMGDLIAPDGSSASQWLMAERGWPPYVGP